MTELGWLMVGAGWLMMVGLSVACFRASRDDGDRTPQGKLARGTAFLFGMVFAALALMPLGDIIEHWWKAKPTAEQRFGCSKTYVNAKGEDTGECN